MRPDVNPADAAQLGNLGLLQSGTFDTTALFPSALGNLQLGANQVSQVIVPEWIGQTKVEYQFPRKFEGGLIFYYGSYRDYWNPDLTECCERSTYLWGARGDLQNCIVRVIGNTL